MRLASSISAAKTGVFISSWSSWALCDAQWHGDRHQKGVQRPLYPKTLGGQCHVSVTNAKGHNTVPPVMSDSESQKIHEKADRLAIREHAGENPAVMA